MILITERNELFREIYNRLFTCAGYEVIVKESPEEALSSLESIPFSVNLLLLGVKEVTDSEALLVKRVRERLRNCKILLLIYEMSKEVEIFIKENQIKSYIRYPFIPSELLEEVSILCPDVSD
jgi:DNA-binding response OmpR family regulator